MGGQHNMFRTAELGRKVSKEEFDAVAPQLRIDLLGLQQRLRRADFPVILVFAGVDGAGKGETINLLNEWMDPRWLDTHAYGPPSDEEAERPEFWRYWRDLPARGRIGLFLSSWYHAPVVERAYGRITEAELDERLARVSTFEKMLAADGALVLKFWMHLGKKAQKKRFKKLEKDPLKAWHVQPEDWEHHKKYDRYVLAIEEMLERTDTEWGRWTIIEATDKRWARIKIFRTIIHRLEEALQQREHPLPGEKPEAVKETPVDAASDVAQPDLSAPVVEESASKVEIPDVASTQSAEE